MKHQTLSDDEFFKEFKRKKKHLESIKQSGKSRTAYTKYKRMIKRRYWNFIVPEYEVMIDEELKQLKQKLRRNDMAKYEVECSLTNGFNRVAVNIREIEPSEFDMIKESVVKEARSIWKKLPNSDETNTTKVKTEVRTKSYQENKHYKQKQESFTAPNGDITIDDIKLVSKEYAQAQGIRNYIGTRGQHLKLVEIINQGKATLQEVNNLQSYQELQALFTRAWKK